MISSADGHDSHAEADALRSLHHKFLPEVIDILETAEGTAIVMEYVRGKSLEQILQENERLSYESVLQLGLQLCDVLEYLHTRPHSILHLDLKPANILIRRDGRPVLIDFGASETEGHERKKRMGSDGYAAPEQYVPGTKLSVKTDLYALAAVMYTSLTGEVYSREESRKKIPGCPSWLDEILSCCMSEEPGDRPGNARVLRRMLLHGRKIYGREQMRKNFWAALILMLAALGIAGHAMGISGR